MLFIQEINFCEPLRLLRAFGDQPGTVFLDSAQVSSTSRYSFMGIDPFLTCQSKANQILINQKRYWGNPFDYLRQLLAKYTLTAQENSACPFQGGVMGYFGYGLAHHFEALSKPFFDEMSFDDMSLGFYDVVVGFDVFAKKAWVFSSGYPETTWVARKNRAALRCRFLVEKIKCVSELEPLTPHFNESVGKIKTNFTSAAYQAMVSKAIDFILSGDIFEVNVSQRFHAKLPQNFSSLTLYEALRAINPAPFAAYLNCGAMQLISASPEQFLELRGKKVTTKPIKGTCPRGSTPQLDQTFAQNLLASTKNRAENIMIVDLMRNDLSRVCENFSIEVHKLCELESFATVHHLVSTITGQLCQGKDAVDLLCVTLPGGSVTGAPKIRAMEIITELEQHARGPYCGSIGYIGFDGNMDTSIIIRTLAIKNNTLVFQAGGAVVADSDPLSEYQEMLQKADALLKCLL